METFEFRLEKVLRLRNLKEETQKRIWAEFCQKLMEEQECLIKLRDLCQKRAEQLNNLPIGKITALHLQRYAEYLEDARITLKDQKLLVEELKKKGRELRAALLKATQERKIMENLKKRHRLQHKQKEEKLENNILDEITCLRFGRKPVLGI